MRKYIPTIWLAVMYLAGEAHIIWRLFGFDNSEQNWILVKYMPMSMGWNIKMASGQLQWILASLMVITYPKSRNKENATSMIVFLLWTIFDTILYFWNYKQIGYFGMYLWLPAAWLLIYYWNSKITKWLWRQLDVIKHR